MTLAVGMSNIFTQATAKISQGINLDAVVKYWYHFAIMFEALFILTTIDTGTRIARFLLQEALGKIYPKFDQTDWLPGRAPGRTSVRSHPALSPAICSFTSYWSDQNQGRGW